jgi:hypothetical protein
MSDSTEPGGTGDGFDDPTAPAWASPEPAAPTQPIPSEPPVAPPSPYVAPQPAASPEPHPPAPHGQDPYGQDPYGQDPYGQNPYGQPPYPQQPYPQQPYDPATTGQDHIQSPYAPSPYGSPFGAPTPYGQAPYGSTAYGQPAYSLPPAPYGAPPGKNTSAIVLTVISAVTLLACCNLLAVPSLVLGIIGLNKAGTDPQGSARVTRAGWITFAVTAGLVVIGWVVFVALAASGALDGSQSDFGSL